MKAITKQEVAVSRVGIISTPNHPTYNRLLVDVMNAASLAQSDVPVELFSQMDAVIQESRNGVAKGKSNEHLFVSKKETKKTRHGLD